MNIKYNFIKKSKAIWILFFLIMIFLSFNSTVEADNGYTIQSYDIDMTVNENNTFDITEKIVANFTGKDKHGIYRTIPLRNTIVRTDGTSSKNIAKITNLEVSEDYKVSKFLWNFKIKIGNKNKLVSGIHEYTIKYNYNIGEDPLEGADELYFNLIGTEWDTMIRSATFTIRMPKEFDKSSLGFSCGSYGNTDGSRVLYTVDGNVITGSATFLRKWEGVTVRLTLPEGYFVGASDNYIDFYIKFTIIISFVFVIIAFLLWKKHGKSNKVIKNIEYYPPESCNPVEVEVFYKGDITNKSVEAMFVSLANRGYIRIEEIERKTLTRKKKSFNIVKVKNYDGDNAIEKTFLNGLFKKDVTVSIDEMKEITKLANTQGENVNLLDVIEKATEGETDESISGEELQNRYGRVLWRIRQRSKEIANKVFESKNKIAKNCILVMIIVLFSLITVKPAFLCNELFPIVLIPSAIFGYTMMFSAIWGKMGNKSLLINNKLVDSKISYILYGLCFGLVFGLIPTLLTLYVSIKAHEIYVITFIIGMVCIVILYWFREHISKRTSYGNEMLGKVQGFKTFLETADTNQLTALASENSGYFYEILPYMYVLGISEERISQMEEMVIQNPSWYVGTEKFNLQQFVDFLNKRET